MKLFTKLAALVFAIGCIAHAVRLFLKWGITVNGLTVPLWVSYPGMIVAGILAFMLWRESQIK